MAITPSAILENPMLHANFVVRPGVIADGRLTLRE